MYEKNSPSDEDDDAASYHNHAVRSKAASAQSKTKNILFPMNTFAHALRLHLWGRQTAARKNL